MFRHCVKLLFVPFYFVRFPDFFLGDQFTSHSQTLVDLLHVLVSLFTGSFLYFRDPFASYSPTTLSVIQISLSILPQFIRLAQNLRRYHDSKYASSIEEWLVGNFIQVSTMVSSISYRSSPTVWFFLNFPISVLNSFIPFMLCVGIYMKTGVGFWTLFHVGLLRIRQDKTLLRAKCLIPYPVAYYLAIVNNTVLRFAWILKLFIVIVRWVVWTARWTLRIRTRCCWCLDVSRWYDGTFGMSFEWKTSRWITVESSGKRRLGFCDY